VTTEYNYNAFISYRYKSVLDFAGALEKGLQQVGKSLFEIRNLSIYRDLENQ
jgi:hypothetical protein